MAKEKVLVPDLSFEEEENTSEDQEIEVLVEGRDEIPKETSEEDSLPEEYRGLTKSQLVAALSEAKKGPDQATALREAINGLGEKLSKPTAPSSNPVPVPIQQRGESDEEFAARVNKELFGENPLSVVREVIRREINPLVQELRGTILQQTKRLLEKDSKDGPILEKYREEVEATIASLPPEQRTHPGAYEWAIKEVRGKHFEEIVQAEVEARLKAQEEPAPSRKPQITQGATSRGPLAPTSKKRVIISAEKAAELERKGINVSDYVRIYGGE